MQQQAQPPLSKQKPIVLTIIGTYGMIYGTDMNLENREFSPRNINRIPTMGFRARWTLTLALLGSTSLMACAPKSENLNTGAGQVQSGQTVDKPQLSVVDSAGTAVAQVKENAPAVAPQ